MLQEALFIRMLSGTGHALQGCISLLLEAFGLDLLVPAAVVKFLAGMIMVVVYMALALGGHAAAIMAGWA